MSDLTDALRAAMEALEKATPGPWEVDYVGDIQANGEDVCHVVTRDDHTMHDVQAIPAAVNFLRQHGAEIERMARDAERYRWLRLRLAAEELDSEHAALIALRMVGPIGKRPADPDYNGELDDFIDTAIAARARGGENG